RRSLVRASIPPSGSADLLRPSPRIFVFCTRSVETFIARGRIFHRPSRTNVDIASIPAAAWLANIRSRFATEEWFLQSIWGLHYLIQCSKALKDSCHRRSADLRAADGRLAASV